MIDDTAIIRLEEAMKSLTEKTDGYGKDIKQIKEAILGNGQAGLKTEMALTKQSVARIWWWLGGISMAILGSAAWIIRSGVV